MKANSKISLVLLNWNGHEDSVECLNSLQNLNYDNFDIYLVDNNSQPESVEYIKSYLQRSSYTYDVKEKCELDGYIKPDSVDVLFILNDENSGFACGNNVALNYILATKNTDYVLLLNNDTTVKPNLLSEMISEYVKYPDTGFMGVKHYYYHEPGKIQTIGGGLVDKTHGEAMAIREPGVTDVYDFITGSCILMSFEVLETVGVMYCDYFMYWEDVDWSATAREYGYKLRICDRTSIYHKEGASIKSLKRIYYHTRNRIWYIKRHSSRNIYYKFLIYIVLYVMKESVMNIAKNTQYSKILIKALIDGLRNKKRII